MTYLSLEETKQISLNCLIFVDKFCKEHNLKYSIAYGTLLGAIRHKGFIPWDDDIDIVMMREDYEKFLDCFEKNNTDKNFSLFSFEKGTYYFPFSKIVDTSTRTKTNFLPLEGLGIGIDIFPYDGVGNTVKTYEKLKKKARFIARLNQYAVMKKDYKFSGPSKIIKVPMFYYAKLKGLQHWRYKIEKVTTIYSNQDCKYVDYVADLESLPTEKAFFDELTDLEFEGYMFKGPVRYNDCLTNWYGSYMELPPEDQRQPHAQKAWRVKK